MKKSQNWILILLALLPQMGMIATLRSGGASRHGYGVVMNWSASLCQGSPFSTG